MDVVEDYKTKSNDPFILATWNLVKHDWEFYFMKVFMVMEVLIQIPAFIIGTYGLRKNTPLVYPLLLCYASAALVTTTTVFFVSVNLPSANDTSLDATSKFYALTDEGRRTILGPIIPFLLIPAVMWVDMLIRVTSLVSAGIQKTATAGKTGKKEL
ncbi:SubName: Full=Uncharacterized protein {ECO:0000313/EMBL:CCA73114.1} [Serendipita indica DSM 11827]|nr:SubName: Full=Uncharacterized protein {ECO:0000313/EMBL:CCA73114.1} [Serendipita indica DSM 11827]